MKILTVIITYCPDNKYLAEVAIKSGPKQWQAFKKYWDHFPTHADALSTVRSGEKLIERNAELTFQALAVMYSYL